MANRTEILRYNLRDRGRSHRGTPRNFDVAKVARLLNSPAVQEKVALRDMIGFFGHWPRVKFGLNPSEGGVVNGKAVSVEPALVTTHLKAYEDGTIEHQAEFLDTEAGKLAAKLFKSRAGGFSSAFDGRQSDFFGFDYVLEPNYSTNRGYALDSAAEGDEPLSEEDVQAAEEQQIADYLDSIKTMNDTLDGIEQREALQASLDSANQELAEWKAKTEAAEGREAALRVTVAKLTEDNEGYLSALAAGGALDSLGELSISTIPAGARNSLEARADRFKNGQLAKLEPLPDPKSEKDARDFDRIQSMFLGR